MLKFFIPVLCSLMLISCTGQDETYYRTHPQMLQKALEKCSDSTVSSVSCQQLQQVAYDINQLIFEMQTGPQRFGEKIMTLQLELAGADTEESKDTLRKKLAMRLAVVRWLQSPES